jgi:hypothetical protein
VRDAAASGAAGGTALGAIWAGAFFFFRLGMEAAGSAAGSALAVTSAGWVAVAVGAVVRNAAAAMAD